MVTQDDQRQIVSDNIKRLLKKKGKTQRDMAADLNIAETTVSSWIRGTKYPRIDKIQMMADYFGVYRSEITEAYAVNKKPVQRTTTIPVLGEIACGNPLQVMEEATYYRAEPADQLPPGNLFYLQAKGDSMEPTIPEGAYALIRHQQDVESGEIAAVLLNGDTEATLKRVKKQNGTVILMADNHDYDPIVITEDHQAKIIGKAVRVTYDI